MELHRCNSADVSQAKLIATLGQKELGNSLTNITWKDYGVYEQTAWSAKGSVNEFLGGTGSTTATHQIHFPVTPNPHLEEEDGILIK